MSTEDVTKGRKSQKKHRAADKDENHDDSKPFIVQQENSSNKSSKSSFYLQEILWYDIYWKGILIFVCFILSMKSNFSVSATISIWILLAIACGILYIECYATAFTILGKNYYILLMYWFLPSRTVIALFLLIYPSLYPSEPSEDPIQRLFPLFSTILSIYILVSDVVFYYFIGHYPKTTAADRNTES